MASANKKEKSKEQQKKAVGVGLTLVGAGWAIGAILIVCVPCGVAGVLIGVAGGFLLA